MKKLAYSFLVGAALLSAVPVFAEAPEDRMEPANRAVNITLGSSGGGLDNAALRSVRKLVGGGYHRRYSRYICCL